MEENYGFLVACIIMLTIFLVIVYLGCTCSVGKTGKKTVEGMTQETLIFFYADWCGYCKSFKPEVDKVTTIKVQYVNCTSPGEKEKQMMKEYNVSGFPALFYKSGKDVFTFNKDRSLKGIEDFVKESRTKLS